MKLSEFKENKSSFMAKSAVERPIKSKTPFRSRKR